MEFICLGNLKYYYWYIDLFAFVVSKYFGECFCSVGFTMTLVSVCDILAVVADDLCQIPYLTAHASYNRLSL